MLDIGEVRLLVGVQGVGTQMAMKSMPEILLKSDVASRRPSPVSFRRVA